MIMNAFWLMAPLFLIRFALLGLINKRAIARAAFYPPLEGKEKTACLFYQLSNIFIVGYPLALKIQTGSALFTPAMAVYSIGILVLIVSTVNFAAPNQSGLNINGIYKLSRNPMYIGYFLYYLGCVFLTHSLLLFFALLIFQISAHWIILSEERWCIHQFGSAYISYMNKVRRYI